MFYTIYRIKNILNDRYYIGAHVTDNLEDGYMGSGDLIELAIKKHGRENFTKEYLFFALNEEDMYWAEEQLVITRKIDPQSYNKIPGGIKPPINYGNKHALGMTYSHSLSAKKAISKAQIGRIRSIEDIEKFRKNRIGKGTGQRNSMAKQEYRDKVSASKIGRKRIYREDGSYYLSSRVA